MAEKLKPPAKPPRFKVDWSRSEKSHFSNNIVAENGNINSLGRKPFGYSLDSKLQNFAANEQEYDDADEDGRSLSPREQHETHEPNGSRNQMAQGSSTWLKDTDSPAFFPNLVWQKHGKSRKKQNITPFSHSFNSYRKSRVNYEEKSEKERKASEIKTELYQTFISDFKEKPGVNQLTNNKQLNDTNDNMDSNLPKRGQLVNENHINHTQESNLSNQQLWGTSTSSDSTDEKRIFGRCSSNHKNNYDSSTHKDGVSNETRSDLRPGKGSEIMQNSKGRKHEVTDDAIAFIPPTCAGFQDNMLTDDIENSYSKRSFSHARSLAYTNTDLEEMLDSLKPEIESDQSIVHGVETILSKNTCNKSNIQTCDNTPDLPTSEPPPLISSEQWNGWNTPREQQRENVDAFQLNIDYVPEIPPSPPHSESYRYINRYNNWNACLRHKAEIPKPRVITLVVYCGSRRYHSKMSYKLDEKPTELNQVNNGDFDYDMGIDSEMSENIVASESRSELEGHNSPHKSSGNNAYDSTSQMNWDSTFDTNSQVTCNDPQDIHDVLQTEKRRTNVTGLVTRPQSNTEIVSSQERSNLVSNFENLNDTSDSRSFNANIKVKGFIESTDDRVFPSSTKTPQTLQNYSNGAIDVSQKTGLNCGSIPISEDISANTSISRTSQEFGQWNQPHERSSNVTKDSQFQRQHKDQMPQNSSNSDTPMSHGDVHPEYKDTYRQELESRTFEGKANIPWKIESGNFESSSLPLSTPSDNGIQYDQNTYDDEIEELPISSKALSYPNHPNLQQSNRQGTHFSQTSTGHSMDYGYHEQNRHMEHGDTAAEDLHFEDDGMQYSPHDDEEYTTVVSKERGCGNCTNCKAMEMMDTMKVLAQSAGFVIHDVLPDGNCMFRSVVDQLRMFGDLDTTAGELRSRTVEYLTNNPCSEDGTHMKDFLLTETWEQYLVRMKRDGEWGDEIALRGISEVLKRKICIMSAVGKQHNQITIQPGGTEPGQLEDLYLGHLNDSHYLSLRHSNWLNTWFANARKMKNTKKMKMISVDDRNFEKTPLSFEKMLDLNEELEDKLLYQTELIDSLSATPLQHLSFVMKNVMNSKYFELVYFDFDKQMEISPPPVSFSPVATGLNAEMLEIQVTDQMSMRLTTRKQTTPKGPNILVPMNFDLVKSNEDSNKETDLIVDNENVHPGYLRLRPVSETFLNKGHILLDEDNNMFLKRSFFNANHLKSRIRVPWSQNSQTNGFGAVSMCFKCNFLPESTKEWQNRHRPSGWPKQQCINQALNIGCFALSEAHPKSSNQEIEYMYSFGEAEKIFARSFLKSQKYCFHVFRLVIELVTRGYPQLGIYHIKTIFFYASEVMPRRYWRLNPGACLLFLISRLLSCLRHRAMPHYFIKDNNILDCFRDDVITELLNRIGSVREFPITVVILLAEEHGLSTSWMADHIIADIEHFCIHQDLKKSLMQVFVPTSLKLAENFIGYSMYSNAAEVVMENYNNMKYLCNAYEASLDVPPLFFFIQPVMNPLTLVQRWWLCFFIDLEYEEDTLSFLTENDEGKTIAEMVGEDNKGELGHVFVSQQILSPQSCPHLSSEYDSSDIDFLHYLTMHLNYAGKYDINAHYQRCLVQLIKSKIMNNTDKKHEFTKSATAGNQVEYMKITILYQKLYSTLISLYHSYCHEGHPELFQEYIHDLENTCDAVATKSAYKHLSNIWSTLGSSEMSQRALEKRRHLDH